MAGYKSLIIKRRAGYFVANQAIPLEQAKEKRYSKITVRKITQ